MKVTYKMAFLSVRLSRKSDLTGFDLDNFFSIDRIETDFGEKILSELSGNPSYADPTYADSTVLG